MYVYGPRALGSTKKQRNISEVTVLAVAVPIDSILTAVFVATFRRPSGQSSKVETKALQQGHISISVSTAPPQGRAHIWQIGRASTSKISLKGRAANVSNTQELEPT